MEAMKEDFVVVDPTPVPSPISISCSAEHAQLAAGEAHQSLALVSLAASAHAPAARLPLEVVAVVDRSGSMHGAKMRTMIQTLSFLVTKGLLPGDSLAIVDFHDTVETRLALTKMDQAGKAKALDRIGELSPGRTTNLSGGLLQGIDLLVRSPPARSSTRAILLFTDGLANAGICDGPGLVAAAQGAMGDAPATIFTFGFGADHNEDMLRSLASVTTGLYYFIRTVEAIPQAFADCLGGLVAVVAQNCTLSLTAAPGVELSGLKTSYKTSATADGGVEVSLGDIYAEEEKDLVVQLALPALPGPVGAAACLKAALRFYSVPASAFVDCEAVLSIGRPAAAPAEQPVNGRLETQRLRLAAVEAMAKAASLADEGRIEEGRAMLEQCRVTSLASVASATAECKALLSDLERVASGYKDAVQYRSWGGKLSKMSAMSHAQQRSNHATGGHFEKASKRLTKMRFAE